MNNFWTKLKRPFFVLAPMDEVTDVVFREVVTRVGQPDVLFTEFTNVEGLNSRGREKLLPRLKYTENQRPIVAQIWGHEPDNYFKTAQDLVKMGFDGIDINMGCPVKKITKHGSCSALIENPTLAAEIIAATKKGAAGKIPVSVKTRLGFHQIKTEEWITFLLKQDIAVLTVHGRTAKEMSKVPAHWDEIKKAVEIRNKLGVKTLIVGNGDVENYQDGINKAKETGVNGIMIGRGIFKDVFAFLDKKPKVSEEEMLNLLLFHARLFLETYKGQRYFLILRRFFKIYVNSFYNGKQLKEKLVQTSNIEEVEKIIKDYLDSSKPTQSILGKSILTSF
jgi:nifR3 family TIM-barrel protein